MHEQLTRRNVLKAAGVAAVAFSAGSLAACATGAGAVGNGDLAAHLRRTLPADRVLVAGDGAYDTERAAFHRTIDHRPAAIVSPRDEQEAARAVLVAAERQTPIAVQATGHGIGRSARDGLLLNTRHLESIRIDPNARTAVVGGGVLFSALIAAAAEHGLAPLNGSAPGVGVVGYTTGGGLPVIGRSMGYAADHVRRITLVDANGDIRRLTPSSETDLFWAVRGGKSNFGIVTEIETALFPVSRIYGGSMTFVDRVPEVLAAYQAFTRDLTDQMTTSLIIVNIPAGASSFPPQLHGKTIVKIRVAFLGSATAGEQLLRPLRALTPMQDSVADMPYAEVGKIYADPAGPMRARERAGELRNLDDTTVDRILEAAGPGAAKPPFALEIRHLGGALARTPEHPNAVGHRDADCTLFLAAPAPDPAADSTIEAIQEHTFNLLRPSLTGHVLPNYLTGHDVTPEQVRRAYTDADYSRLASLKRPVDPHNLFRVNHNIAPAA
ncbi:FAD-binding oxidoreductase [Nocardia sp. XZ_19_385]|uniref:FAD-binding oxidoreductase n=1 Tax=Nocardia sp. XZ_19_385 TaxID=2769488 RepID=UPI00188EEFA6|nr:FAD-binding oxidoreductase [Nocardia sp. XZ_19_385]